MKKTIALLLALCMMFALCACGQSASPAATPQPSPTQEAEQPEAEPAAAPEPEEEPPAEAAITLRLGDAAAPALGSAIAAQNFAALVNEASGGRIVIDYYGNAQLGDDGDLMEQVVDGTLDIGIVSCSMFSQYSDVINALQLPFLIDDYEKEYVAITSPEATALFDTLKPFNIKVLGAFENGITHFANNKKAIETPEDLNGLLLRCASASVVVDAMNALNISTADIAFNEIYTALQNGVIEGEVQNIGSIFSMKHYEVANYISLIGIYPFPVLIAMSDKSFSALSEEDQAILIDCAAQAMKESLESVSNYETNVCLKTMQDEGVHVNEITDKAAFIDATKSVYDKYMENDLVAAFVEMVRGL